MVAFALGTLFIKPRMSTTDLQVRGIAGQSPLARCCGLRRCSVRHAAHRCVGWPLQCFRYICRVTTMLSWGAPHRSFVLHVQGGRLFISVLFYCAYFLTASGWSELSIAVRRCPRPCVSLVASAARGLKWFGSGAASRCSSKCPRPGGMCTWCRTAPTRVTPSRAHVVSEPGLLFFSNEAFRVTTAARGGLRRPMMRSACLHHAVVRL
jgi:hypothetical protein